MLVRWKRLAGLGTAPGLASSAADQPDHQPEAGRLLAGTDALTVVVAALGPARRQALARAFELERSRFEVSDPPRAALCQAIALLLLHHAIGEGGAPK